MELNVLNDKDASAVDWWFMYKLPQNAINGGEKTSGKEYLYYDSRSRSALKLSNRDIDDKQGALQATLAQIYKRAADVPGDTGWICYNDEVPGANSNDGDKGHTKGVLAFDLETDTAFWLLHSWPKFPDIRSGDMAAWGYGQTFLCISLKNVETARYIAEQMYHRQEPQTYECCIPESLDSSDIFNRLANAVDVNETDPPCDITFFSRGGQDFRLMAKNRHWGRDFWIDHVGPHLMQDIDVETWRRLAIPGTEDSDGHGDVTDILYINLEKLGVPCEWHYTKDHAKWGISEKPDWVCVADINRQVSQEKRGGGSICFRNKGLWQALSQIEQLKR
jgi:deoxyribonuclease II